MDRFDPFVKYADVYGDIINWEKDPMNKPQNQNKYFFSDGKTYYEQICKMLKLMSVFKEAFNQIYSNEDEISEAWENFVNNLSASVVEGSEPDVTLTWTDDSVNFEFTMVPGVPGEQGVGITSISFNSDYTMTITLSDGNTYTSMSLKGETGPQGPQGETGSGLQILDVYATLADLQSAHPTGQPGDAYQVGSAETYTLYIWSSSQSAWIPAGSLGTVSPSVSNPLMDGTASAGSSDLYSRGDHVHPTDTSRASKEELDALIKTSQALIDQSFTYRESPAVQDGLAKFDKIKGNTIVWNQLIGRTDSYTTNKNGITLTITGSADKSISLTAQGTVNLTAEDQNYYGLILPINVKNGHKYLLSSSSSNFCLFGYNAGITQADQQKSIFTSATDGTMNFTVRPIRSVFTEGKVINETLYVMFIDLTQMFGSGNEPSTVEEFTSLFPLSYYSYNQCSLLSFNGNGIKTVGSNLVDITSLNASTTNTTLLNLDREITTTIDLPISTYFPTGMKSAGDVYDELTESKAITRIGSRAYQSGDESDTSVITDGTNTYYVLETPTETAVDLDLSFNAYENGTEQLLPVNGSVPSTSPIIADMTYLSIDDAMEYIIDKLANVPLNTQQILDSLEDDVADLQTDVGALQPAVSALQTSVGNINTNIGQLSSTVAGHTSSISDMQSDITDLNAGLSNIEDTVTDNTSRIGTLESGLSTTNGNVQNLETSVSDLGSTVTAQGETVTALDNFVSNIANTRNPGYMSSDNSIGITSAFLNMTLAAGQSTWANIPLPTIMAGFIPLFVVGASTGDGSVCLFKIPSTYNQNNIYKVGVKNTSNSEVTTQVGIEILCIKQRQTQ